MSGGRCNKHRLLVLELGQPQTGKSVVNSSAVIVDVIRTPSGRGKPGGSLSGVHPVDLLATTLRALVECNGVDPATIDDVIGGCVAQVAARYPDGLVGQGISAELITSKWGFSRAQLDDFAARSHQLAAEAAAGGYFANELIAVGDVTTDETVRPAKTAEGLAGLKVLEHAGPGRTIFSGVKNVDDSRSHRGPRKTM